MNSNPQKMIHGFVKIAVSGEQTERFLNLCRAREIHLQKVRSLSEKNISAYISIKDFKKLQPIHSKTKVKIRILEKKGLPFWIHRNQKRKCFWAGGLFCFLLMLWLSGHIWNIHIDGNIKNSTPEILKFLDEQGIIHGISKKEVNCTKLAALLREQYPDITFVSVRVQGTRLLLSISEEALTEDLQEKKAPCDLVADISGEIVSIVMKNGTLNVKTGDICQQGDVLIFGQVDILNDSQEVVHTDYVPAEGEIYVRHQIPYYQELSLFYEKKTADGKPLKSWYLHLGNWIFGAGTEEKNQHTTFVEEYPWQITENFFLPCAIGKITRVPYKVTKAAYTKKQAEEKLVEQFRIYEKNLLEEGKKVENSSLSVNMEENSCVLKGTLTVVEKCGIQKEKNY